MKLKYKILITFCVVLLHCSSKSWAWLAFNVVFTSFPLQFNGKLLHVKRQIQNSLNTAESNISVQLNVLEVIDDISLTYVLGLGGSQANNYTIILDRKVHFCKFLSQHNIDNVLRLIYKDILKHNRNFIKKCPLKKGYYTVHEYQIKKELLPSYLPETNFFVDILLEKANDSMMILKGRLHGIIDKTKGFHDFKTFGLG